jgi:hypothetical protein
MRAFSPAPSSSVRLSVDEGAIVVGLLDFFIEPELHRSPDVVGLAERTRRRVSAAVAAAINEPPASAEVREVIRHTRELVGDSGPVSIPATDRLLRALRAELAVVAA